MPTPQHWRRGCWNFAISQMVPSPGALLPGVLGLDPVPPPCGNSLFPAAHASFCKSVEPAVLGCGPVSPDSQESMQDVTRESEACL